MDDDDDDFQQLFFTECEELLEALQEKLNDLEEGTGDEETLHAAFRAVHSIKGGAAAFGFDDLIGFAHAFETVMDRARSDELDLTPEICNLMQRSGDVMGVLVEKAQTGDTEPPANMEKVIGELQVLSGAAPADKAAPAQSAEPDPKPAEATPTEAPAGEEPAGADVVVHFIPDPTFFRAGHDILKLIRAAQDIGLSGVECLGDMPQLADLSLDACPFTWRMTFAAGTTLEKLNTFFMVYEAASQFEVENPEAASSAPEAAEQNAPPAAEEPEKQAKTPAPANAPANADGDAVKTAEATDAKPAPAKKPAPAPAARAKPAAKSARQPNKSLRVDLSRVDRLVNLVGEIVITQAALAQRLGESDDDMDLEISHSVEAMSRQTRDLQESVMAIRAQPIKSVFSRMPRIVRDLADTLGKDVRLELSGEQTEVDTTVIEELAEPLTHMLRNSMDHGLEGPEDRAAAGKPKTGVIRLSAEHRGERIIITLGDDGRGINRERVLAKAIENGIVSESDNLSPEDIDQLIFHAGFSTAKEISSVSGRGVGMDVVKKKLQELGGRCQLTNVPGKGCTFTIALPLTLAVLDGMTVVVGEQRFIVPISNVVEAVDLGDLKLHGLPDQSQVLSRRGVYLPLMSIRNILSVPNGESTEENMAIIVDTETDGHVALLVDKLIGQRQVVLKSLEANYKPVEGVSGATILGDGRIALILDVPNLVALNRARSEATRETLH